MAETTDSKGLLTIGTLDDGNPVFSIPESGAYVCPPGQQGILFDLNAGCRSQPKQIEAGDFVDISREITSLERLALSILMGDLDAIYPLMDEIQMTLSRPPVKPSANFRPVVNMASSDDH
jgi:hypothetical protein